jgi:recombination protein RecA
MAKDKVRSTDGAYKVSAQQLFDIKREIIPCTLSSDIALSGGVPRGATVLIGGKPKLGKTTFSLQCGANAQNLFGSKIFYFNIEGRLSKLVLSQIQGINLDSDKFQVVMPPPILDKADNVIGYKKWGAENWWMEIGSCIENNPGCVIIVDSIANLSSEKEQSEDMGFQDRGGRNKLEAEFCRKYGNIIVPNQVTLFLLTQIQANTSGYGPPVQAKVGNHIRHQADIIMFGKNFEKWDEQNGRILGHNMIYNVEASALGAPFMEMKIPLRYGYGIDNIKDVMDHCINWEIIRKGGAWYTLPFLEDGTRVDLDALDDSQKPIKVQGEDKVRNWLLIHPEQTKMLDKEIREKVFG